MKRSGNHNGYAPRRSIRVDVRRRFSVYQRGGTRQYTAPLQQPSQFVLVSLSRDTVHENISRAFVIRFSTVGGQLQRCADLAGHLSLINVHAYVFDPNASLRVDRLLLRFYVAQPSRRLANAAGCLLVLLHFCYAELYRRTALLEAVHGFELMCIRGITAVLLVIALLTGQEPEPWCDQCADWSASAHNCQWFLAALCPAGSFLLY